MIDYQKYTSDAVRTESVKDTVTMYERHAKTAINMAILALQILDTVKKLAFYGKKVDSAHMDELVAQLDDELWSFSLPDDFYSNHIEIKGNTRALHAILGIATEAGELLEILQHSLNDNTPLDYEHLHEELGDLNWYQAILVQSTDGCMDKILDRNIAKLKARYGEKFSEDRAISRDLFSEQEALKDTYQGPNTIKTGNKELEAQGNLIYHQYRASLKN